MRVHLKGINSHTAKLADGTTKTYWYALKGGPRLQGEPGTPEFIASYNETAAKKFKAPTGLLFSLLQAYQASEDFRQLAPRTREDYKRIIQKEIEPEYSDFPLSGLTDKRTRGIFMEWRDKLALKSRRQADYAWTVLARVLSWSKNRGKIAVNPCERGGRIYSGSRSESVWSAEQEAAFLRSAPAHLHLPLLLGLWTGQRQGDLLRLPWSAYNGTQIKLCQSKTGARLVIPVGTPLKAALDATAKHSPIILTTIDGKPWTAAGFRASWGNQAAAKLPRGQLLPPPSLLRRGTTFFARNAPPPMQQAAQTTARPFFVSLGACAAQSPSTSKTLTGHYSSFVDQIHR